MRSAASSEPRPVEIATEILGRLQANAKAWPCRACGEALTPDEQDRPVQADGSEQLCRECIRKAIDQGRKSRERNIVPAMQAAGVSLSHAQASLTDFRPLPHGGLAAGDPPGFPRGFRGYLLCGPWGTGKTHLAAALLRGFIVAGKRARFLSCRALMREVQSTYSDGSPRSEKQVLEGLYRHDLLVVDDVGKEGRKSDAGLSLLYDVLSHRLDNLRPVVVTTNLPLRGFSTDGVFYPGIAEVYDGGIASRLEFLEQVVIDGADRRRAGGAR